MTRMLSSETNPALKLMDVPKCWELGLSGNGIGIGHLDTGVDGQHPSLKGLIAQYRVFDDDGLQANHATISDTGTHGTNTASILCGRDGIGVAPRAHLYSGVVIEGGKSIVRVLSGLDWLLDQPIKVLNMPLGIPYHNPVFQKMLERIRSSGKLAILPVGNFGEGLVCSPATDNCVLSVGAVDLNSTVPTFSGSGLEDSWKHGFCPHLVAPGCDVIVAEPGGIITRTSGTSMASAYVAGIAALLFEAYPNATPDDIEKVLIDSCCPLDNSPPHRCGYGIVNARAAVELLIQHE